MAAAPTAKHSPSGTFSRSQTAFVALHHFGIGGCTSALILAQVCHLFEFTGIKIFVFFSVCVCRPSGQQFRLYILIGILKLLLEHSACLL